MQKKGLIIINTGEGKGKSTAAFGMVFRAWGHEMKVGVVQFIKNEHAHFGEIKAARKLGIVWYVTGNGFVNPDEEPIEAIRRVEEGWKLAQEMIVSDEYDLLVLDEFTYALHYDWLDTADALKWLRENKPERLNLVITGRSAPDALIAAADLVTEMVQIKHPFDLGIPAQRGVEF